MSHPNPPQTAAVDRLIPPPRSPLGRVLVAGGILLLAVAVSALTVAGWIYPRPLAGASAGGDVAAVLDHDLGLVGLDVFVPNGSGRSVRLESVSLLDAEGAQVRRVDVSVDGGSTWSAVPAVVEARGVARVRFWMEPDQCEQTLSLAAAPWGIAEIVVDFGQGAFPPFSRSYRLDDQPLWAGEELRAIDGDIVTIANEPVVLLCEAVAS